MNFYTFNFETLNLDYSSICQFVFNKSKTVFIFLVLALISCNQTDDKTKGQTNEKQLIREKFEKETIAKMDQENKFFFNFWFGMSHDEYRIVDSISTISDRYIKINSLKYFILKLGVSDSIVLGCAPDFENDTLRKLTLVSEEISYSRSRSEFPLDYFEYRELVSNNGKASRTIQLYIDVYGKPDSEEFLKPVTDIDLFYPDYFLRQIRPTWDSSWEITILKWKLDNYSIMIQYGSNEVRTTKSKDEKFKAFGEFHITYEDNDLEYVLNRMRIEREKKEKQIRDKAKEHI